MHTNNQGSTKKIFILKWNLNHDNFYLQVLPPKLNTDKHSMINPGKGWGRKCSTTRHTNQYYI